MAVEDSAAHIGAVLDPAVSTHDSPMGNIAVAAHDRLISKNSAPIRVAVIADNGVVIDPCMAITHTNQANREKELKADGTISSERHAD